MGQLENIQHDFDQIQQVGGDKAAIFHGLDHLWTETIAAAGSLFQQHDQEKDTAKVVLFPVESITTLSLDHHLRQGDKCFGLKEYQKAMDVYHKVVQTDLETQDRVLLDKQANAKLMYAKCFYALDQPESALQVLDEMLHTDTTALLQGDLQVRVLLWMGRCKRHQKHFEEALESLEKALDRLSLSTTTQASEMNSSAISWLRQSILMEIQVVGIFRKGVLEGLLSPLQKGTEDESVPLPASQTASEEDDQAARRTAQKTVRTMVDLFHCPLSLELMQDPVMTPNGDTYEREMIERHLDINGQFDPMTRAPLEKTQLSPNRALKLLMETLLSDHKLGLLLLASGAT